MGKFKFEYLEVYQRSLKLSIELIKIVVKWRYEYARLRDQIIGAVSSIPQNIAEGNGRQTAKDRKNFYIMSRTSNFELIPLLEIVHSQKLINDERYNNIRKEIEEISMMLTGLINCQR